MTGYDDERVKREPFSGIKWPLKYGPASGKWGLAENIKDIAQLRERLGPEPDIMLDCWMGLDPRYTLALDDALREFNIKWIEEPLVAGDVEGYRQLRREWNSSTLIACGEHETLLRGFAPFARERLVDVWQADVTWAGGITQMQKIAALALDADIAIIPHYGYIPWAAQFILACRASPMIEWYNLDIEFPGGQPLFESDMELRQGRLYPGTAPGFGIRLNWEVVEQNLDRRVSVRALGWGIRMFSDVTFDFAGRTAIITGVGSPKGIGRALLRGFADAGAHVAGCDIDEDQLAEVLREQPDALVKKVDVRDKGQVFDFVQRAAAHYGRIDMLVNNAGIAPFCPIIDLEEADLGQDIRHQCQRLFPIRSSRSAANDRPRAGREHRECDIRERA